MLLNVKSLQLAFGPKSLFADAAFQLQPNERVGLVGPNGSGKTTLMRLLNGVGEADSATIEFPADATIGYLPQEGIVHTGTSVFAEAESAAGTILSVRAQLAETEQAIAALPTDSPAYHDALHRMGHLQHRLDAMESHKLKARIEKILFGLGFSRPDMDKPCTAFSGGWQMRIALAKLLLAEPDLLLLDEPTNHLDLDSLRWLEAFLRNYEGAILLISHDRSFLDALAQRILSIENAAIVSYTGNFSRFLDQFAERQRQRLEAKKSQDRKIAQTERFIERFRYKASKATQVQSRIKQLDKVERIELESAARTIHFRFPEAPHSGQTVIALDAIHKAYGDTPVFSDFSLRIERGHRIGVVGINGAGKSTLARILAGREPFQSGTRTEGHQLVTGYFAQDQTAEFPPDASVFSIAANYAVDTRETAIRNVLGAFLFSADDLNKPIRVLSGGEKNRLALARLLLRPANFLILDEPTNHLDMASKAVLQDALRAFNGTLFIVSHDRDFIQPVADRILEVSPSGSRLFPGPLDDYLWKIDQERKLSATPIASASPNTPAADSDNPRDRRRRAALLREQTAPLRKRIAEAEASIQHLEAAIAEREAAMADKAFFERGDATAADLKAYDAWKAQLDATLADWEAAAARLEQLESEDNA